MKVTAQVRAWTGMYRSRYGHGMEAHHIVEFRLTRDERAGEWVATALWRGGPVLRDADFQSLHNQCVAARCKKDLFGPPLASVWSA